MITPARSCASSVEAARCGVTTTSDLSGAQRVDESRLVDEFPACSVDEADAVTHLRERLGSDRAARLVGQGKVERDEVRRSVDVVLALEALDSELAKSLR
jgi:hypothetical protein